MGMLTWSADQSCSRHRTLQLGGGGEGVGDTPQSQWWDIATGQLALCALRGVKKHGEKLSYSGHSCTSVSLKIKPNTNLDGVMVNNVATSADLVVVLERGRPGLSLLQLLRHQLLCLQRWRGWRATVREWWGSLLKDALVYFLLLLQCFDKGSFQPIGVLSFQSLFLIGWHAVFTEDCAPFSLVLPPPAGEVSVALGADKGVFGSGLGQRYTRLSWMERDGKARYID